MKKILVLLALVFCAIPCIAQQYPPYIFLDANLNPYPSGSGSALGSNPPYALCYTNVTGQPLPCNFGGSGPSFSYPTGTGIVTVTSGAAWGATLTAPAGTIVGTTDTQTLTNKTVDGVTPTVFGYVDPTSSIQTQLNSKGTGTVTSVTFTGDGILDSSTPSTAVTTSGTVTATPLTQTANTVLAGPSTGSAATPTFRALVAADIPSLSGTYLPLAGGTMTGSITLTHDTAALQSTTNGGAACSGFLVYSGNQFIGCTISQAGALILQNPSGSTVEMPDITGHGTAGNLCVTSAGLLSVCNVSGSLTYTTATSDTATVTGATSSSHCTFSPTNATAAAATVVGYISAVTTNSVTITHVATAASGGTVNILCTIN